MHLDYAFRARRGRPPKNRPTTYPVLNHASLLLWKPKFAQGIQRKTNLEAEVYGFAMNAGISGLGLDPIRTEVNLDCEAIVNDLRSGIARTGAMVTRLKALLKICPPEARDQFSLVIDSYCCRGGVTGRCRIDFGTYVPDRALAALLRSEFGETEFLHLSNVLPVTSMADRMLTPITSDIAALLVITFDQCVDMFRKAFKVTVYMRPELAMLHNDAYPCSRLNVGLCYRNEALCAKNDEAESAANRLKEANMLLDRFAHQYPDGSPEGFVTVVEASPEASRAAVVLILERAGYVTGPEERAAPHRRGPVYARKTIFYDNRRLTELVRELTAALDLARPYWRNGRAAA